MTDRPDFVCAHDLTLRWRSLLPGLLKELTTGNHPENQHHYEDADKQEEQELSDACCRTHDSCETKSAGDQGDNKED